MSDLHSKSNLSYTEAFYTNILSKQVCNTKLSCISLDNFMSLNWINSKYDPQKSKQLKKFLTFTLMIKAIRSAIAIKAKVNMIQSIIDLVEQVEPKPRNYDSITCIGCENQA